MGMHCEECARLTEAYLTAVKRHARLLEQFQSASEEPDLSLLAEAEWQVTVNRTLFSAHRLKAHPKAGEATSSATEEP